MGEKRERERLRTLKHTNRLKGIVHTTSTQEQKMRIFPHSSEFPSFAAANEAVI